MSNNKITATMADEIALEQQYKKNAETVLLASYNQAIKDGTAGVTKVGSKLIDHTFNPVKDNFIKAIFENEYAQGGIKPLYWDTVLRLKNIFGDDSKDELYNMLVLITMNALVSSALQDKGEVNTRSAVANAIASDIAIEVKAWYYIHHASKQDKMFFEQGLSHRVQKKYKVEFAKALYAKEAMKDWQDLDGEQLGRLADWLIEYAVKGSGFFELIESEDKVKGTVHGRTVIRPKQWLINTWLKNVDILAKASYKYCPMIVAPRSWKDIWTGGYWDCLTKKVHLLRVDWDFSNAFMTAYKKRLNNMDMSYLLNVVNALQATPFTINDKVLAVATYIYNHHGGKAGIDSTEPMPKMPRLEGATPEEEKAYRRQLTMMYKAERARQSRLLRLSISLGTAKKFSKYAKIYFPWNMDYRGRLYPISTELSPQGDDIQKAMLLFAEPSPCLDEKAKDWFIIEGANRAGIDKVSFDARLQWVKDNEENILASAERPLEVDWWTEQDSPFLFLAWCFEYIKFKKYLTEHEGSVIGFKTGIPINYDGTCSGLQHFSMILKDEVGGKAVNLVPQETVSDIYGIVAAKINPILKRDALEGTDDGLKYDKEGNIMKTSEGKPITQYGTKTLAQWWITYAREKFGTEGITRKVCKRSVMTLAYGSGQYGFAENLKSDIILPYEYKHWKNPLFLSKSQAANYMAKLIWDAVSTTVVKAVEGMKWLQKVAKLITKNHEVVQWVTPNGLLVQQNKYKEKFKTIKMKINGNSHRLYIKEAPTDIDNKGQVQAISPNFIHSMDASHMQRVITALHKIKDQNLFMIHDSFGTDLAHADVMFKTIRFELRHLYEDTNYLQKFLDNVSYLLGDTTKIPKIPEQGKLSIADVEKSKYCFA